jgi:D-3-phosphoglycerate dehydrogenase
MRVVKHLSVERILVADDVSDAGLKPLLDEGFVVDKQLSLSPDALGNALRNCVGLIVRSETKVTAALMDCAPALKVIGRAGVGVDNIDVDAAKARGVIVMNAPDGNTVTTAEHTVALLVALARKLPEANTSVKAGKWERKKFIGVQLQGKTLGIIGLGRIGRAVAVRARSFGMNIVGHDPFVATEQAQNDEIRLAALDDMLAAADFITIHTPLTDKTRGLLGRVAFQKMKPGVRLINCARGGLIDEVALYDAIRSGIVAGAALDVFEQEPPAQDHPLFELDEVITTPHLGASTTEAQEGVAFIVSEQVRDYLLSGVVRGAVNMPELGIKELNTLRPYLALAESLGRIQTQLVDSPVREVRLQFAGEVVDFDEAPIAQSFLAGLLRNMSARVNNVNAFLIAKERGIIVTTSRLRSGGESGPAIQTSVVSIDGKQSVGGTVFGLTGGTRQGRITEISGFHVEAIPRGHLLVTRNRDVPGVIGRIGTILGDSGVNISRFHLGRNQPGGETIAVIETDGAVVEDTLRELRAFEQLISVRRIDLSPSTYSSPED